MEKTVQGEFHLQYWYPRMDNSVEHSVSGIFPNGFEETVTKLSGARVSIVDDHVVSCSCFLSRSVSDMHSCVLEASAKRLWTKHGAFSSTCFRLSLTTSELSMRGRSRTCRRKTSTFCLWRLTSLLKSALERQS